MGRVLKLVSPGMRGDDVRALQKMLKGRNEFGKNFHPGYVDGRYGPQTAAAVSRAKFFMGYPKRRVNGNAGKAFLGFLSGKVPLPRSFRVRRRRRFVVLKRRETMRRVALQCALDKVGLAETPEGSNKNRLTRWWYGNDTAAPWCAISVSHSYIQAGSKAFRRGSDWAYVPFMENAAVEGRGLSRVGKDGVQPGDVVTFDFDGGVADHVGIFVRWLNKRGGVFEAVEGNTDAAGGADGGEQIVQQRGMSQVSMFIRVMR